MDVVFGFCLLFLALGIVRLQITEFGIEKDRLVKGTVTAKGDLIATGKTAAELKASTAGIVKMHIEKGIIRKVNTLYKILQ